jgi:hypothetical protein
MSEHREYKEHNSPLDTGYVRLEPWLKDRPNGRVVLMSSDQSPELCGQRDDRR